MSTAQLLIEVGTEELPPKSLLRLSEAFASDLVDGLREAELAWALNKLEGLSDQQRNIVLAFSQRLVNKIMHQPTIRLKQHANGREATRYTEAVRDLFGIGDDECSADGGRAHG